MERASLTVTSHLVEQTTREVGGEGQPNQAGHRVGGQAAPAKYPRVQGVGRVSDPTIQHEPDRMGRGGGDNVRKVE